MATPKRSQGSCFFVSKNGLVITNYHVIEGAKEISVHYKTGLVTPANVEKVSKTTDLAILSTNTDSSDYLPLAASESSYAGQPVFTLGFPVVSLLGSEPKYTDGVISALSGIQGEASFLQVTTPIQPGNSGGPLINEQGEVVGVVTSTAAITPFFDATGSLPQNINWAIKGEYLRVLLPIVKEAVRQPLTKKDAIDHAKKAVCYITTRE